MKYKYELHCHTSPVSACSRFKVSDMVDTYIEKGYNGVVLTNHINSNTFRNQPTSRWKDLIDYYLSDYREAIAYADGRLNILLGLEVSFAENANDYLVYGIDEKFLYKNEHMSHIDKKKFSERVRKSGFLFFQAHPFRNGMTITDPSILDGIEINNAHPRHNSRNDIAALWCEKHGLLYSGGSDAHEPDDVSSGIITDIEIKDNATLLEVLKSGNFEIIR